ncbi:MAG: MCE family protein [Deltaproteobacteria bacterium]|nr:MCE family protein [Deltaproteobacteria bacterium]
MSRQANKTLVGAFVVGALALAMAGVMIFGSGKLFKKTKDFVMYFQGGVGGLNVGAPLYLKGVKVGSVREIKLLADPKELDFSVPVIVEFDPGSLQLVEKEHLNPQARPLHELIKMGLRAQLQTQSMVTGQLAINLDFYPKEPVRLVNKFIDLPEIPTIPSTMDMLSQSLEKLPLNQIAERLNGALGGLDRLVNSPALQGAAKNLGSTLEKARDLFSNLDQRVTSLTEELQKAVKDTRQLVQRVDSKVDPLADEATQLLRNVDDRVTPLVESIRQTAEAANLTITEAQKVMVSADRILGDKSQIKYEVSQTLEELSAAARSVRIWANYLERHPEALLQGKKE